MVESDPFVPPQGTSPSGLLVTPSIQVPRGVNPNRVKLVHMRGNTEIEAVNRATTQWRKLADAPAVGQSRFTDRYGAVVTADLPLVVHEALQLRTGDIVKLQIAPETLTFEGGDSGDAAASAKAAVAELTVPSALSLVAGTWQTLNIANVFDLNEGGFTVANGRMVVPSNAPGIYRVSAGIEAERQTTEDGGGGRTTILVRLGRRRGGTTTWSDKTGAGYLRGASTSNLIVAKATNLLKLQAGDEIEIGITAQGANQTVVVTGARSTLELNSVGGTQGPIGPAGGR